MSQITSLVFSVLVQLYQVFGNLGIALIVFTAILRSLLLPITYKSIKAQKKMRELQPELNKLKNKHSDKKKLQKAQMELYQKYNVNPLAGCLPQIVQIGILIVLYRVLIDFLGQDTVNGTAIDPYFLWMDLRSPDKSLILPVVVAGSQLIFSLMVLPGGEVRDVIPNKSKSKKVQEENKKEEGMADMAASMQKQMIFMMPVMTGFFASRFPSGLALYWLATTVFSIGQQLAISGPGGLVIYTQRAIVFVKSKIG